VLQGKIAPAGRYVLAGRTDDGPPGLRHYHPDYYGAFLRDPDGNRVEAACHLAP
jgi:hypothetical protein